MWYFKHLKSIQTFYWGLYGPADQVHFCSRLALSGFMSFYFQMFKLASFIWAIFKKRIRSFLGMHLEKRAFLSIFLDLFYDCHSVRLRSYASFNVWLSICLVIPFFLWSFIFLTLCTILGLPILQLMVFLDAYANSLEI